MSDTPYLPKPSEPLRGRSTGNFTVPFDPAPYPEVKKSHDDQDNRATVAMLKEDYAGAVSELTAITQYIFQNTTAEDPAFANAMLQIAIAEMTHLDMLGDAIETLGGDPRYDDGRYYWNASYVDYARPRPDMLRANIKAETAAIQNYQTHAAATKNPTVRDFLLRIIRDEQLHLAFFNEQLAKIPL